MTTPLQEAFPDVDIIVGVTEFEVVGTNNHHFNLGESVFLRNDDETNYPFFGSCSSTLIQFIPIDQLKLKETK